MKILSISPLCRLSPLRPFPQISNLHKIAIINKMFLSIMVIPYQINRVKKLILKHEVIMKKFVLFFSSCLLMATAALVARDLTEDMPEFAHPFRSYFKQANMAQYKNADWSNVVYIARGITLPEAGAFAENDDRITSFFYTKGDQMVLETESGDVRIFRKGDTVFFSGDEQWAPAPGLADVYLKLN